ncbi:hypothetical protein SpCBS45565_g07759 [Spizellomyces sp. 'palustris']|nr:hypothetical protein SpCBS45565_g07759 [Spizellomyces sp. 'palustris']
MAFRGLALQVFWLVLPATPTGRNAFTLSLISLSACWTGSILLKYFLIRKAKFGCREAVGFKMVDSFYIGAIAVMPLLYLQKDSDHDQASRTLLLWSASFTVNRCGNGRMAPVEGVVQAAVSSNWRQGELRVGLMVLYVKLLSSNHLKTVETSHGTWQVSAN